MVYIFKLAMTPSTILKGSAESIVQYQTLITTFARIILIVNSSFSKILENMLGFMCMFKNFYLCVNFCGVL